MNSIANKHKNLWPDKFYIASVIIGLLFFSISLLINYSAVVYSTEVAGNATTDILLQNIPVWNTDIIFSEGAIVFAIFMIVLLVLEPKTIPFTLKSLALFITIRAIFVSMTHLGPPINQIDSELNSLFYLTSGADLFFSGHTGIPFLLSLMYWQNKVLRYVFLSCSLIAAFAVLFGHLHYTIDVFSAFFISYGIFHIARSIFKKDYSLFIFGLKEDKVI